MQVEKKLIRYIYLKKKILSCQHKIENILWKPEFGAPEGLKTAKISHMRVDGGDKTFAFAEQLEKILERYYEELDKYNDIIADCKAEMQEIENWVYVAPLTDTELEYIDLRYFKGKKVKYIADEMGYSERNLCYIKTRALKKLYL